MTDPIRPAGPTSEPHVIELDPVIITAGADPIELKSIPVYPMSVPVPLGELATHCLSKLDGVAVAVLAGAADPPLGALMALKSGLEIGECARETVDRVEREAGVRRAIAQCAAEGGTPLGMLPDSLTCAVPVESP